MTDQQTTLEQVIAEMRGVVLGLRMCGHRGMASQVERWADGLAALAVPSSASREAVKDPCAKCGHSGEQAHLKMDNITGTWKRPCMACGCGDYLPTPAGPAAGATP